METAIHNVLALTAGDLMNRDVIVLRETMPLREAARLLCENQVSGAPVVDAGGQCVGVLSTTDFLRLAMKHPDIRRAAGAPQPVSCLFQIKHRDKDGRENILCTLPPGMCAIQRQIRRNGKDMVVCSQPYCVLADWQIIDKLPNDEVRNFMSVDLVLVSSETSIGELASLMAGAHVHRVVVVDESKRPIGIVSSTDVLAAVGRADAEESIG